VFFGPPDEEFAEALFLERGKGGPGGADPSVISAFLGLRNRNPCGMVTSNAQAIAMNRNNANKIEVPVLLVFPGEDDPIVSRDGEESEADNYGGSDVTSAWLDSGHFMMLEDCAPAFRRLTAHWINEHWGSGEKTSMPTVGSHECVTEVRHKGPERN
jgi:pimeloyl-ACP methyl ester carboxylesterase